MLKPKVPPPDLDRPRHLWYHIDCSINRIEKSPPQVDTSSPTIIDTLCPWFLDVRINYCAIKRWREWVRIMDEKFRW